MKSSKARTGSRCLLIYAAIFIFIALLSQTSAYAETPLSSGTMQQVLSFAVVGPLTPSSKSFGIPHLQGITLAIEEYNIEHPEATHVQLKIFDDQADPSRSVSIVKALSKSDVIAILGPANSTASAAVINLIQEDGLQIPVVSALSTASHLTENLRTNFFFRANVSDRKRLTALLNLIFIDEALRPRRLLVFYERADTFGEGMLNDTKDWLNHNNRTFLDHNVLALGYPRDVTNEDVEQLISDASSRGFGTKNDGVLILGVATDTVTFINTLRNKNVQSTIYFNEPDQLVFKSAAERGIPIKGLHVITVYWPDNAIVNSFKPSFQKRFNEEPSFSAALSYDATRMLLRALEVALADGLSPSKNIEVFRKRVSANLRSDMGDSLEFVVSGNHKFENSEYRRLDFQRLQYDSHGDLVQWDKILEEPHLLPVVWGKAIELPPLYSVIFVVIFGYIGSILREFSRQPPENVRHFIGRMMSPISTLIDPAISLIVFGCLFLIMLFTKRNLLETGGDALLIYKVGSALVGVISGFLGLRALYEVIKYLGIKIEEKDITGESAKS